MTLQKPQLFIHVCGQLMDIALKIHIIFCVLCQIFLFKVHFITRIIPHFLEWKNQFCVIQRTFSPLFMGVSLFVQDFKCPNAGVCKLTPIS
jgi:hypothetical protein